MSVLYKPLDSAVEEDAGLTELSPDGRDTFSSISLSPNRSTSQRAMSQSLWLLAIFLVGVLSTAAFFLSGQGCNRRPTYENRFSEEKIRIKYVGATNSEGDRAWEELLWGRYFSLSEAETKKLWGADCQIYYDREKTGYTGEFDMFHQLHCLNQIRQVFHRDYYPEMPIHGQVHLDCLDHCINRLRQAIQFWGSTTITPIKWFEGYHHGYVQSNVMKPCRKLEPIRDYVSERFNGSLRVPREGELATENDSPF